MTDWSLEASYDDFPRIEEEFQAFLDESLSPRGPEMLFDLVAELRVAPDAHVLDLGCGEGGHALTLAERFGVEVTGIDPVARHVELADASLAERPDLTALVSFGVGSAEAIPLPGAELELVWCVDVLSHLSSVTAAAAEIRRVLRPRGHALVYSMMGTELLEPQEAAWLWASMGVVPGSADPAAVEQGFEAGGLTIERRIVVGSEWGERIEERTGKAARKLLHAARLRRDPDRYIGRFGRGAYEIMLADCHWAVYALLGKLSRHVYVLRPSAP